MSTSTTSLIAEIQSIKNELDSMDFSEEYLIHFEGINVATEEDASHLPQEWIEFIEEDEDEFFVALTCRFTSEECLTNMSHEEVSKIIGADKFPELVIDCVEL